MLKRPARGQALVMGLVVLFMGAIMLFFLFSTGQVSADKQRVTNAADAAAYSAALWRARVLNYDAYSNRAMIANEVAIAQTLTLASETQYLKNLTLCLAQEPGDGGVTCTATISYILQIVPYFTEALSAASAVITEYDEILQPVVMGEVEARSNLMNRLLSLSQTTLDLSTNFLAVQTIVDQVSTANDAHFTTKMLPDTFAGPGGFTKQYSDTDRIRLATLVRQGLDKYSQDRGFNLTVIPHFCFAGIQTPGTDLKKRGGTTLDTSLDWYEAADGLSEWDYPASVKGCPSDESPMGWGDRQASGGTSDQDTGHVRDNPRALEYARNATVTPDGYIGIQPFRDLNYAGLNGSDPQVKNPTATLGVVTHLSGTNLRTANTLNIGTGRLRMPESLDRNELSSVAAAQVYFERPAPRADGRVEYPSLFNPYWQARLAEPTVAQRAEALLL
jgi:Flp pilus assembly protein TadG